MIMFNLLPYWFLAVRYWGMSYQFEELITEDQLVRPNWHKYVNPLMILAIVLVILILGIVFAALDIEDNRVWLENLFITAFAVFIFFNCFILGFLGHAIHRVKLVTEGTDFQPNMKIMRLVVFTFAVNCLCFILYSF